MTMPVMPTGGLSGANFADRSAQTTLRQVHKLMRAVNSGLDLGETMTSVVESVVAGLGFGVAVFSMVEPSGDLTVTAVAGDPNARETLLGTRAARAEWDRLLTVGEQAGPNRTLRLIDHRGSETWDGDAIPSWVPALIEPPVAPADDRLPWHPLDALFAPLSSATAGLLGVLSVDLPADGLRPGKNQLGLLEVFAAQATIALEHARLHAELLGANELARTALATRLQTLVDASPAAIIEIDRSGVVQHWSRSAEALLGYSAEQVVGHPLPTIIDRVLDVEATFAFFESHEALPATELLCTRLDGSIVQVDVHAAATHDAAGTVQGVMALLVDITDRKHLEGRLVQQATHDALSGLPNRRLFDTRLKAALAAGPGFTAVLFVDLDRFKEVNDTFGHLYGDLLLVEVGERLRTLLRPGDTLARMAGDEFAVVLAALADCEDGERWAARVLAALHRPYDLRGVRVDVEASIGIAFATEADETAEELLHRADVAMYAAKQDSKGVVAFVPHLLTPAPGRIALLGELRHALDHHELLLHYQPQIDVQTGHLKGIEALVRWQHPTRGLLAPVAFLDVAESTGLILPLTLQVLDQACAEAARWARLGTPVVVAVNLSSRCVHDPDLAGHVQRALLRHGLPAALLKLEMTESAVMSYPERALGVLCELAAAGHGLSLDDFGTGFSSLSHLRNIPATELKVDRSFVTHMVRNPQDQVLVRSIIDLAHNLGLLVVAEGIEDAETLDVLKRLGCDLAQGHHIAVPMPADDLAHWIGSTGADGRRRSGRAR